MTDDNRSSFAADIEAAAYGEPIEHVVIGAVGDDDRSAPNFYDDEVDPRWLPASACREEVLTWDEGRPLLDYPYDCGFGGQDCHSVYAYTATKVLLVAEYDGATRVVAVPRNPTPCCPVTA